MSRTSVRASVVGESSRTIVNGMVGLAAGFLCGIITARSLGPTDRGNLSLILVTSGLSALIGGLGTNVSLRVDLGRDPRISVNGYARLSAVLGVAFTIVYGALVLGMAATGWLHVTISAVLAAIIAGTTAFAAQQFLDVLNAEGYNSAASLANSLGSVVTLLGLVLGHFVIHSGLAWVLWSYAAGFVFSACFSWFSYRRIPTKIGFDHDPTAADQSSWRPLMHRGVRLLGLNLGQSLAFRLDHFALSLIAGPAALGLFSVAAAHVAPTQVASNSIGQVAFREAAHRQLGSPKAIVMGLSAAAIALVAAVVLWFLSPWLVPSLFGSQFDSAVPVVRVLIISQIGLAPYLVLSRAAAGRGWLLISSGGGVVFLVILLPLLIVLTRAYGAVGAASADLVASTLMSMAAAAAYVMMNRRSAS